MFFCKPYNNIFTYLKYYILNCVFFVIRYGTVQSVAVGLAKGCIGLVGKPIVGVLDATTHVGDSVRGAVREVSLKSKEPLRRRKCNTPLGPDMRLLPYDLKITLGFRLLQQCDNFLQQKKDDLTKIPFLSSLVNSVLKQPKKPAMSTKHDDSFEEEDDDDVLQDEYAMDLRNIRSNHDFLRSSLFKTYHKPVEYDHNEYVIYTLNINNDLVKLIEEFIIVTNRRLVTCVIKKGPQSAILSLWQCNLHNIVDTSFKYKTLKINLEPNVQRRVRYDYWNCEEIFEKSFTGTNFFEIEQLKKIQLILSAVSNNLDKCKIDELVSYPTNWDDLYKVFHVGPWQFSKFDGDGKILVDETILKLGWKEPKQHGSLSISTTPLFSKVVHDDTKPTPTPTTQVTQNLSPLNNSLTVNDSFLSQTSFHNDKIDVESRKNLMNQLKHIKASREMLTGKSDRESLEPSKLLDDLEMSTKNIGSYKSKLSKIYKNRYSSGSGTSKLSSNDGSQDTQVQSKASTKNIKSEEFDNKLDNLDEISLNSSGSFDHLPDKSEDVSNQVDNECCKNFNENLINNKNHISSETFTETFNSSNVIGNITFEIPDNSHLKSVEEKVETYLNNEELNEKVKPYDDSNKTLSSKPNNYDPKFPSTHNVFKLGDVIEARYMEGSRWFPGEIVGVNSDGTYNIRYRNGDEEINASKEFVRLFIEASSLKFRSSSDTIPRRESRPASEKLEFTPSYTVAKESSSNDQDDADDSETAYLKTRNFITYTRGSTAKKKSIKKNSESED